MLKSNNMGVVPVNGNSADATQVCWDGKQQVPLPANYVGKNCGPSHKVVTVVVTNPGQRLYRDAGDYDRRTGRRRNHGHRHGTIPGCPQRPDRLDSDHQWRLELYERADGDHHGWRRVGRLGRRRDRGAWRSARFTHVEQPGRAVLRERAVGIDQRRAGQRRNRHRDGQFRLRLHLLHRGRRKLSRQRCDHVHASRAGAGPDSQRPPTRRPEADPITCSAGSICP